MGNDDTLVKKAAPGISLNGNPLFLDQLHRLVNKNLQLQWPLAVELHSRLAKSAALVKDAVDSGQSIYGVTTGFGGMSNSNLGRESAGSLQSNLLTFLAAGAGAEIDSRHTRAAMILRANVLLQGKSGIRADVVQRLIEFVRHDAVPVVRELGSIGASGDLVPLATIARAITGQSDRSLVRIDDELFDSTAALKKLGLTPIELRAKEGLALVNGTSFSCAIAANATVAARQGLSVSLVIESLMMSALCVNTNPFEAFVHQSKPHPGQIWAAEVALNLLKNASRDLQQGDLVQDRYALRCFPQYVGAIVEGMAKVEQVVETEMNAVSDNPLIDPDSGKIFQSGNFLGQYIGIAMDDLRRYLGLLAKHLDVQIASLVAPEFNRGLPASLRGNEQLPYNMGLKGLQICGNSIMPLLTWRANPIVEHFPTHAEQFNQNVNGLSWGAANLAWKSVCTFQQYLAIASIFAVQAIDLRAKQSVGHYDGRELLSDAQTRFYETVCDLLSVVPERDRPFLFDDSDRWLEQDVETLAGDLDAGSRSQLVQAVDSVSAAFRDFCGRQP